MHQLARVSGAALSAALLLPLAACGGSEKSGEKGRSDDEVAAVSLASNITGMNAEMSLCTGKALVESLTVTGLQKAKILDDNLVARFQEHAYDHDTATAIAAAYTGCWDWEQFAMGFAGAYRNATDTQWAAYQSCVGELDDELEKSIYANRYKDGKTSDQLILETEEKLCRKELAPPKKR